MVECVPIQFSVKLTISLDTALIEEFTGMILTITYDFLRKPPFLPTL